MLNSFIYSVCKGTLNLMGVGFLAFAMEGFLDPKFLLELTGLFVGLISTAAIMRWRINTLETALLTIKEEAKSEFDNVKVWQEKHDDKQEEYLKEHNELHLKMSLMLSELLQGSKEQGRRVTELEAERWRASRGGS